MTHPEPAPMSIHRDPPGMGIGPIPPWLVRRALCVALAASLAGPVLAQAPSGNQTVAGMVDGDADGVSDDVDDCPYSPPGVAVNARGCSALPDQDGDGVPDSADVCPLSPRGARVAPDGCALDSDGDKVADGLDYCPDTPRNQEVDDQGCAVGETALATTTGTSPSARNPLPPMVAAATTTVTTTTDAPLLPPLPSPPVVESAPVPIHLAEAETVTTTTEPGPTASGVKSVTTQTITVATTPPPVAMVTSNDIVATVPPPPRYDRLAGTGVVGPDGLMSQTARPAAPALRIVRPDPSEIARLREAQRMTGTGTAASGPRMTLDTSRLPLPPEGSETPHRRGRRSTAPSLAPQQASAPPVVVASAVTTIAPPPQAAPTPSETTPLVVTTKPTSVITPSPAPAMVATATRPPAHMTRRPAKTVREPETAPPETISMPIVSSLKPERRGGKATGGSRGARAAAAARKKMRSQGAMTPAASPMMVQPKAGDTTGTPGMTAARINRPSQPVMATTSDVVPGKELLYSGRVSYTGFTVDYRATLPSGLPVAVPDDVRASLNAFADGARRLLTADPGLRYVVAGCQVGGHEADDSRAQARAVAVGGIIAARLGPAFRDRVGIDRPLLVSPGYLPAREACADVRAVHVAVASAEPAAMPATPSAMPVSTMPSPAPEASTVTTMTTTTIPTSPMAEPMPVAPSATTPTPTPPGG